jgi:hypothetical protein
MGLQQLMHLLQLGLIIGIEGEHRLLPLDLALGILEVETGRDLAFDIVQRIVDLVQVGLGNDVETGHSRDPRKDRPAPS